MRATLRAPINARPDAKRTVSPLTPALSPLRGEGDQLRCIIALLGAVVALLVGGCQKAAQSSAPPPRMVSQVIAVPARTQTVSETLSLVGSVAANEMVEVKSEVDGTVQEVNFKEGHKVEKGQLLVKLDDSK